MGTIKLEASQTSGGGGGGGTSSFNELTDRPKYNDQEMTSFTNIPLVPTKTSDLENDEDFVADEDYVHTDNNYTDAEKTKLDGIANGAEVNVQSDWATSDTTYDSYIKNKPTIGNGKITIKKNGTQLTVFTANQTADVVADIIVPTDTSDLTNNAGFITDDDLATVATTGSYNDLSNKPTIPTPYTLPAATNSTLGGIKVGAGLAVASDGTLSASGAEVTIDDEMSLISVNPVQNRVISEALTGKVDSSSLATVATTGAYSDLSGKPTIPTKVSDLTNDVGYIKVILSTTDIEEGDPLAANTLYCVYE